LNSPLGITDRLCRKHSEWDRNVLESGVDQCLRLRWSIDVDGVCRIRPIQSVEIVTHHVRKTEIVIWMQVREEDRPDLLGLNACLDRSAQRPDTAVDQVLVSVDDE
jgi:hypothetical protein